MTPDEIAKRNQLASDWMHQGMDLAQAGSFERAVRCFDEAIALRLTLPLEEDPHFRYGLSAGWINRGDALKALGASSRDEAIRSYDEALGLLKTLPLEKNVLYPRRLAITRINRGSALQEKEVAGSSREAADCFREAIAVLESPAAAGVADRIQLQSGAWSNLASALLAGELVSDQEIRSAAQSALDLVKPIEKSDLAAAAISLGARHLLCRIAVKSILAGKTLTEDALAQSTDAAEDGLALAHHWKFQDQSQLIPVVRGIFRFACRIHEHTHPQFLASFLEDHLTPEILGTGNLYDAETGDAVRAAIWGVIGQMQKEGFGNIATSGFDGFLAEIEALRKIEERLLSSASRH